jgi:hypothetical protein
MACVQVSVPSFAMLEYAEQHDFGSTCPKDASIRESIHTTHSLHITHTCHLKKDALRLSRK